MSHRKCFFKTICKDDMLAIVIASIGVGMALAIILPFWWWIIIVAVCLVVYAVNNYFF